MIHSMTAYGRSEDSNSQSSISCEIRSINHRYSEISIRLPEELRPLEQKIRDHISDKIKRGKIECNIRIEQYNTYNEVLSINQELLKNIIEAAEETNSNLSTFAPLNSLDLLRWPGVLEKSTLDVEKIGKSIFQLVDEAINIVIDTRQREGKKIKKMLTERCSKIKKIINNVRKQMPTILKNVRKKLTQRIQEISNELNDDRLEQELLFLSQKMDIEEEIDRLNAHVDEVIRVIDQKEPIGRRLDFLMQEMNRESNTLGSKSNHIYTSNASVELKVLIEQMREQIQNIE
ncbi:MAG: YicC/YloC family endoribonuclease [Pseudomonadota bacterium]|nr:YicC/YloC family endoribonuclease [Pseudomonadota bacterium]